MAGRTTGGIILAHEVARQLGVRAVYAERREDGPGRVLRRGFRLEPGERVLVVDDIMSTGGSVEETIAAVQQAGGTVVGVAVLVDRGSRSQFILPPFARIFFPIFPSASGVKPVCLKYGGFHPLENAFSSRARIFSNDQFKSWGLRQLASASRYSFGISE